MGGRRRSTDRDDPFPSLVTLGCLGLGLLLYVHSTRPALEEKEQLDKVEGRVLEKLRLRHQEHSIEHRRLRSTLRNPEAVIVELDQQGVSPARADELVEQMLEAEERERAEAEARAEAVRAEQSRTQATR